MAHRVKGKSKGRGSFKGEDDVVVRSTYSKDKTTVKEFPMNGSKAAKPDWNQKDFKFLEHKAKGK